ncbi:MAG TPA: sulfotransferase [Devosia sp.]|nr:sulfotransferase [Devosia sp.]
MTALPPDLAELSILASARRKAAEYYAPLLDSDDELVKVGAWCALLDREEVTVEQYPRVVALASHGAIQRRAFRFFESNWEHELAAAVAAKVATSPASARALSMRAELACDDRAAVEAQRYRFLATGRFDALVAMVTRDEAAEGWRAALALAIKVFILNPHDPIAASLVLHLIYEARERDMLRAVLNLLRENALHPYVALAYHAALQLMQGNPRECLKWLGELSAMAAPRPDVLARIRPLTLQLNAEAIDRLGDYRRAYDAYVELNRLDQGKPARLEDFGKVITAAAARPVPELPADGNTDHFVMTGFPRSGTTLLENALAAHPQIETFEEIPSTASMEMYLQTALPHARTPDELVATYQHARQRYYDEQTRRRRKLGATVFVDKLPMRSAEAASMSKIFPEKRYIFSVRHPFDVVLSCFKQHFGRNIAMDHFRSFDGAVKLYDFTMRQWFGSYGLDDPRIHYLRYDDLVTAFEPSLRAVLEFLGVQWDAQVLGFAERAEARSTRTPSYQKVRQGLTIGVQSSWRNYEFLFQSDAAKPLFEWARLFGYPTD